MLNVARLKPCAWKSCGVYTNLYRQVKNTARVLNLIDWRLSVNSGTEGNEVADKMSRNSCKEECSGYVIPAGGSITLL